MVDLTDYLWIVWLTFILVCVIIELLTLDFTFLMIGVGSLAGLGANLLGWEWWVQILFAAAVSVLLLLLIRPVLLRAIAKDSPAVPPLPPGGLARRRCRHSPRSAAARGGCRPARPREAQARWPRRSAHRHGRGRARRNGWPPR